DTVYLLAKELAYDVVTGQTDNLAAALAKTSGKDIVQFAKALDISHTNIDGKICRTKSNGHKYAVYAEETDNGNNDGNNKTSVCGAVAGSTSSHNNGGSNEDTFKNFVSKALKEDGSKNWQTSTEKKGENANGKKPKQNDNAEAVATDLVALNSDEKTIVAGLLAKTIEGGEVVEIRAVSSTSVMVNACYDLLSEGLGVVPYACVGLGGNFVGVVDGTRRPIRPFLTPYTPIK
ncbi:P44/Msp2 family outer membrane protein, partial [Anaplasma phagocytophilum]|uniref:P44/Msp2 family outer membrane protein n=1 Tax=Anaplasma phagocytophilum TaxID=948 RepID=UPI000A7EA47A